MNMRFACAAILLVAGMPHDSAGAAALDGRYIATEPDSIAVTLRESKGSVITGTLTQEGESVPISAKRRGGKIVGKVGTGAATLPFTATIKGSQLIMDLGPSDEAERIVFRRAGTVGAVAPPTAMPGASAGPPPSADIPNRRHVSINNQPLADRELAHIEQAYRVRIADADYWYDNVLGAWGIQGGPTRGFILPGLNLGGRLRPDASNGDTQIFVNGRELHRLDALALQQITGPIIPGRYFITSQGLAGYEGGPPQWNLLAMLAQQSGGGGGGDNIWSSLTGAGNSQGGCSYVNLGNGDFSSSGC